MNEHAEIDGTRQTSMLMIPTEEGEISFIKALNSEKITSWQHFEYVLSFILENRFLRIYQQYLQSRSKHSLPVANEALVLHA